MVKRKTESQTLNETIDSFFESTDTQYRNIDEMLKIAVGMSSLAVIFSVLTLLGIVLCFLK